MTDHRPVEPATVDPAPGASERPRCGVPWRIYFTWMIVLGALGVVFDRVLKHQYNPNRQVAARMTADGTPAVVLERNHFNHYVTPGTINGVPVVFLIDTGATDVSVPAHLADALGLERGRARTYGTANGPAVVFGTRIDRIAIDAIELRDIPASLNPNVAGDEVLLGMSFLKHLEFTQRDRTLVLKPLPERR